MFLPGESQGRGSLVGCRLWGRRESDTTEVTWQLAAAAAYLCYGFTSLQPTGNTGAKETLYLIRHIDLMGHLLL